jgi:hypothetical protein
VGFDIMSNPLRCAYCVTQRLQLCFRIDQHHAEPQLFQLLFAVSLQGPKFFAGVFAFNEEYPSTGEQDEPVRHSGHAGLNEFRSKSACRFYDSNQSDFDGFFHGDSPSKLEMDLADGTMEQ